MITVNKLPDLMGKTGRLPFLRCPCCACEYSAHKGDYWAATHPDEPMRCGECGEPLKLVRRFTRFVEVAS